jgi:hypothetical protein
MRAYINHPRFISRSLILVAMLCAPVIPLSSAEAEIVDPLANGSVEPNLFVNGSPTNPFNRTAPVPHQTSRQNTRSVHYQTNAIPAPPRPSVPSGEVQVLPAPPGAAAAPKDPCGAIENKPLNQLGISITEPAGKLPTNLATSCWNQINTQAAGAPGARCWPVANYNWDATCFYHNPLYFEEVNLERYGYQCGDRSCCVTCGRECCLQPAASAAHFYGSLLALPYCMSAECPGDCVYTLGHYRPGNCNPWRRHWPPFDPIAAAATAGFWVGMVAAFP